MGHPHAPRPASGFPSRSARSRRPAARSAAAGSRCWMARRWWRPARLGDAPWPGTDALFWAEVELQRAATSRGSSRLRCASTRRNSTSRIEGASSPFNVSVVARPEHTLTVKVAADGVPVEDAIVRLGPYARHHRRLRCGRGQTGQGPLRAGRLEGGIRRTDRRRSTIDADASVQIDARAAAGARSRRGLDGVSGLL